MKKCFPDMLAFINVVHAQAFCMRFDKVEKISVEVRLSPEYVKKEMVSKGEGPREWSPRNRLVYPVLEHYTSCGVRDAILLVRPYVKVVAGVVKMLKGRLHMKIDGEIIIDYSPLGKFWITGPVEDYDPDDPIRPPKNSFIFISSPIDSNNQAHPGLGYYGMLLPNASKIEMKLADLEVKDEVTLDVGFVAATYTTKA